MSEQADVQKPPAGAGEPLSIEVESAAYRTRHGYVFEPVSLSAAPGDVVCVAGRAGSGRTALALAITARMKFNEGAISVGGQELPGANSWVRHNSFIGPDNGYAPFDDGIKVIEEAKRAHWLVGKHHRSTPGQIIELAGLDGYEHLTIRKLTVMQRAQLAIACAFAPNVGLVVIDDFAKGIPHDQQSGLWSLVSKCNQRFGSTVVVTTLEADAGRAVAAVMVQLHDSPHPPAQSPEPVVVS